MIGDPVMIAWDDVRELVKMPDGLIAVTLQNGATYEIHQNTLVQLLEGVLVQVA